MVDVIVQLQTVTGNDHNSGFYGKGKKVIMDRVSQSAEARGLLDNLSKYLDLGTISLQITKHMAVILNFSILLILRLKLIQKVISP